MKVQKDSRKKQHRLCDISSFLIFDDLSLFVWLILCIDCIPSVSTSVIQFVSFSVLPFNPSKKVECEYL